MSFYRLRYNWAGSAVIGPSVTTLNFSTGGGTAQQAATAANNFIIALLPYLTGNVNYTLDTSVATVDETNGQTSAVTTVATSTGPGTGTGDFMPPATQLLMRWRTGVFVNGREARGRTFIPGVVESNVSNGTPIGAMQTAMNTAAATLIADATSRLVVWQRSRPTDIPPFVGILRDVTTGQLWDRCAVLRSRRD